MAPRVVTRPGRSGDGPGPATTTVRSKWKRGCRSGDTPGVERFSIGDAAELAGDVGPDQRLIAVLADLDRPLDLGQLRRDVRARVPDHPLLLRRIVRRGRGTWWAGWETVPVSIDDHVFEVDFAESAVRATEALLAAGLPEDLPLWRLVLLTGPSSSHLLFVAHHALLDGATAVAVVGSLLGAGVGAPGTSRTGRRSPLSVLGLFAGVAPGVSASSLLVPIESGFRLASVTVGLEPVLAVARNAGATVNDVLLLAAAESLRTVAAARGEHLRRVVVSVPVTRPPRPGSTVGRNDVGVFVVAVPEPRPRETDRQLLARIAARTRRRKLLASGFSAAPALSYVLALLGYLGWYRPLFSRQRAITTLLTNLRGPDQPITLNGAEVLSLTPTSPALGNVTVVFAAVSYAGQLRLTARLDRSAWPHEELLLSTLRAVLDRVSRAAAATTPG